jgi:AbrB family looped-hinge helix DNA binding protein
MMLKLKSRIGPKGQVVIPKPIRENFGLEPGGIVYFSVDEGEIQLETTPEHVTDKMFSMFEKRSMPKDMDWGKLWDSKYAERLK